MYSIQDWDKIFRDSKSMCIEMLLKCFDKLYIDVHVFEGNVRPWCLLLRSCSSERALVADVGVGVVWLNRNFRLASDDIVDRLRALELELAKIKGELSR